MTIALKIAWRNLWRQPRRTLLTVVTVSLGLALLLIFLGIGDGGHYQMIESAVQMGAGHVLIHQQGYQRKGGIAQVLGPEEIQRAEAWIQEATQHFPIRQSTRRVFASGLGSSADGSTGVRILGVDPLQERKASLFDEKLVAGEFLMPEQTNSVVVGEGVAQKLSLEVGDKLVLMAQAAHSPEIQSLLTRVGGVLRTGLEDSDQTLVLMPLATSQDFLNLPAQVHEVALLVEDVRLSEALAAAGQARLPELEVLSWGEALPELRDFIRIDDGGNYVINLILFLLIGFTVLNTLLMSVLERGREFALLDSLGLTPGRRFVMVLVEATLIAGLSGLLGLGVGYGVHLYLSAYGLPLDLFYSGDISAAGVVFDPVIYSDLSWARIVQSLMVVFGLTMILALAPAWRAARSGEVHLLARR